MSGEAVYRAVERDSNEMGFAATQEGNQIRGQMFSAAYYKL